MIDLMRQILRWHPPDPLEHVIVICVHPEGVLLVTNRWVYMFREDSNELGYIAERRAAI